MASPLKSRLRFEPSWRLSLFVAAFLPLLLSLSYWQWNRAGEVALAEAHLEQMQALPPRPLTRVLAEAEAAVDLLPVSLQGHFVPGVRVWLDNRTWRGRAGYELHVPFAAADFDRLVLVNLGWVAGDVDRSVLPQVQLPATRVVLTGQLAPDRPEPAVFGPVLERLQGDLRVQRLDLEALAAEFGKPLFERVLVADPVGPGVQTWNFRPLRLTAARHRGYALQWLGLGLVLMVGWCVVSLRRTSGSNGDDEHAERT